MIFLKDSSKGVAVLLLLGEEEGVARALFVLLAALPLREKEPLPKKKRY